MADQDYGNCVVFVEHLTEEDIYRDAMDAVGEALCELDIIDQMTILAYYCGKMVSAFVAEDQKKVRADMNRQISRETKAWNIAGCDA